MSKHFVVGVLIGVPAAIAGLVFGIPGMAGAILAVALIASILRLPVLLAGSLIGLGGLWLLLFANQALLCARPDKVCGGTPSGIVPWLAFAVAVLFTGVLIGVFAFRRARRP